MNTPATWLTDEPCPACGTVLHATESSITVTHHCPACGWTATCDLASQREAADD